MSMTRAARPGIVNVRRLSRNTSEVLDAVARSKQPALVMRDGKAVAALYPVESEDWEDWVLTNAPEFVASMREAEEDLRAGRTITLDEYFEGRRKRARTARTGRRRKA